MKPKTDCMILFNGKPTLFKAGVDYKNLPKEITDQFPKARRKAPAKTAKKPASKRARSKT